MNTTENNDFKSGFVAIIGKPNVGKSTVLNYLVGEKIAIVTDKPETTRDKIQGVLTRDDAQIIFVDTPGIHKPINLLGKRITHLAKDSLLESEVIVFILDLTKGIKKEDRLIFDLIKDINKPVIVVLNKADLVSKSLALPLIEEISRMREIKEIIPASAVKGDNMDVLMNKIIECLPYSPKHFSDDQLTDKTERFMVGEIIREKALELTREEIPHSVAVLVEEFKKRPRKKLFYIRATIFIERHSQKKILVGHKGQMLKGIGEAARKDIEEFLKKQVYLDLWVKVYENWRKDPAALRMLGYA